MTDLRARRRDQTRREVGQVALRLFAERGFDGVTVTEIAEAAGISRRTFFTYFKGKEDAALVGASDDLDWLAAALEGRAEGVTFIDVFRDHVQHRMASEAADADRRAWRRTVARAHPEIAAKAAAQRAVAEHRILTPAIARDLGTGEDDPLVSLVAGAFVGVGETLNRLFESPEGASPETLMHEGLDVMGAALTRARELRHVAGG